MKLMVNNRGAVMPLVLVVLTVAVIFGFASLTMMDSQSRFNAIDDSGKKAIEYAEAGYNAYLWHLNDNVSFYSTTESANMQGVDIPFMDGYYRLEVTRPSDTDRFITIKSTGWTKSNPDLKRTIEAKIRKKQFVHHVYVSDNDGENIWWTTGDESHGPYHTNGNLRVEEEPVFYDTVSYSQKYYGRKSNGNAVELTTDTQKKTFNSYYSPDFKIKAPVQPEKVDILEFPTTNAQLKAWAEKDGMVFYGRTCIYLDGENLKIRNGNAATSTAYSIGSIKNKVIYVDKATGGGTGKFDLKSGNIFISGELKGVLTIAAANDIYITYSDPTNWYDYLASDLNNRDVKPNQPPTSFIWSNGRSYSYPEAGGIKYKSTTFTPSYKPAGKDYYIRAASGKDMLGLVANSDIFILHFGWPKMSVNNDTPYWDFVWARSGNKWVKSGYLYDVAPKDINIHSAVFAVNGGFGYESYDAYNGDRAYVRKGDITLWGNITQRTRLPVGLIGTTGYNKKYSHDPRMFYDYPPHILEPVNVGWEIHDWKEIK
ncbi:MAG TPA: hypothetical protein VN580_11220 [Clostridia bacterium]|nr:hypothetical protein [Clostridia bacterium]